MTNSVEVKKSVKKKKVAVPGEMETMIIIPNRIKNQNGEIVLSVKEL